MSKNAERTIFLFACLLLIVGLFMTARVVFFFTPIRINFFLPLSVFQAFFAGFFSLFIAVLLFDLHLGATEWVKVIKSQTKKILLFSLIVLGILGLLCVPVVWNFTSSSSLSCLVALISTFLLFTFTNLASKQ